MPVTLPAPYGKADWADYVDNWREADAEWIQDRLVMRCVDNTTAVTGRNALAQSVGGVCYNASTDMLELKQASGNYLQIRPLPSTLTTDIAGGVTTIRNSGAATGAGVGFSSTEVSVALPLNVLSGTVQVVGGASGYLAIKSGTNTEARLTTTTSLISSLPISAPSIALTGGGTTISAPGQTISVGAVNAGTGSFTGAVSVTGALTGGTSSNVGSVALSGGRATASAGFDSQQGSFYGDGTSAIMRNLARNGPYVQCDSNNVTIAGGSAYMYSLLRIVGAAARIYHESTGKNIAPSFYAASNPGEGNYPDGTIWIN